MKKEQNNIEGRFANINEDIEDMKNKSNMVETTLTDVKDEILKKFKEINSTSMKKFSEIDNVVNIFREELKIDKNQMKSEILSLNTSFSKEIFLLNKSLTNEVNLNRKISKKTKEDVAYLVKNYEKEKLCKNGWHKFGVGSFNSLLLFFFSVL